MPSRKPRKIAVRSTDLGQSGWWILPPTAGIIAGGVSTVSSQLLTHNTASSAIAGVVSATVTGLSAATPQFRDWFSARSRRRQIAESAGATIDIIRDPLDSLRVHTSNRDITEFVPRDIQDQLINHLSNGTPVLIEGPSMSGKTRLTIEVIRSQWPNRPHWFPPDEDSIEIILKNQLQPKRGAIIVLDDLDRFLSNQSLKLGQINRWISNSCIIIATMMHSQYVKHSDRSGEDVAGWDIINRFEKLTLNPSLSTTELKATQLTSYADQLPQIKRNGLGPSLGCAEAARTAFKDELAKHSRCGALIKAAADWRRIGLDPASREQLTSFSLAYEDEAWETVDWNDTWKQATRLINHTVPLLRQIGDDQWEVLDIIADEADWKISEHTFTTLQNITLSAQQTRQTAITMVLQGASPSSTNAMFQRAIAADPHHATTLGAYALFLKNIRGDMEEAEQMYQRAIAADPTNATNLGNYALFLQRERGDMDQAEQMHQRAITADPHHANILGNYAHFLKNTRGDIDQAEQMYQRAITADPHHATHLGNYAIFLEDIRGDMDQAQDMYQRAIAADPHHATNLGNYAHFLKYIRGDTDGAQDMMNKAQDMYQQAIAANPINATTLGAYAFFLQNVSGDMVQAEQMYQRAIAADPINATTLGAYALFLQRERGDMDQAEQMYQRAIDIGSHHADDLGNYALFLHTVRHDPDQAEQMYQRAIAADPHHANILGNYAIFLEDIRGDMDQAQDMYQRAIDADLSNIDILGNYAQILFAKPDDTEAISLTEKAIALADNDDTPLLTECHYYLFSHSPEHRKESGRALKTLLTDGVTTGDWSFEMNLERLRREEDPRLELLEAVARTLEDGDTSRLDAFEEWRDL